MTLSKIWLLTQFVLQMFSMAMIVLLAIMLTCATLLSAAGVIPWLEIAAHFGESDISNAGMIVQIGLTALVLMLAFFVPTSQRVMRLETAHRRFNVDMQDISRAYAAVHSADRAGNFRLASEFDAMRDRLTYLRDHPDLADLEPAILDLASKMSFISKELADTYSDDKVTRARHFLEMRQQEIERFNERLSHAKSVSHELNHWKSALDLEESLARSQLDEMRQTLESLTAQIKGVPNESSADEELPVLDMEPDEDDNDLLALIERNEQKLIAEADRTEHETGPQRSV